MRKQEAPELIGSFLFFLLVSSSMASKSSGNNNITPKAYATQYWDSHIISNNNVARPNQEFLLNKASPLSVSDSARFAELAAHDSLSSHLDSFCNLAGLFCYPDTENSLDHSVHTNGQRRYHSVHTNGQWRYHSVHPNGQRRYHSVHTNGQWRYHSVHPNGQRRYHSVHTNGHRRYHSVHPNGQRQYLDNGIDPKDLPQYFREKMLKEGTVMPMPDIEDKLPPRSFLPPSILSNLPFSSSKLSQLKQIFHASDNSSMETILNDALKDCERPRGPDETKRCVGSIEDMIDFAVSVLGRSTEPKFTKNAEGSNKNILIGKVKGINGGKVTNSVSCHQSLYPYLLYYCHSIPKVRVYEADILDPITKAKINHGVAVCHLDTTMWDPDHMAFLALGPGPGKIEVCHWMYRNDLTWTVAA